MSANEEIKSETKSEEIKSETKSEEKSEGKKEQEIKAEPVQEIKDPATEFWINLNKTASENARKNLEYLMTLDSYTINGKTYESKMVNRQNMGELKKLMREAAELNADLDFDKYSLNIRARSLLVIKDMTVEKFEADDYNLLENIVVAWSLKPRGFRVLQQGV